MERVQRGVLGCHSLPGVLHFAAVAGASLAAAAALCGGVAAAASLVGS